MTSFDSSVSTGMAGHIDHGIALLDAVYDELQAGRLGAEKAQNAVIRLGRICDRFHFVVRQLRDRHDSRETLDVKDEYDVQDLLHSLLRLEFDDIRDEEWTPSYAGGSSRADFLLKREEILIEVKKTRNTLRVKELREQLAIDIQQYRSHPNFKLLVCFVYDPEGLIANPRGVERDLTSDQDKFAVKVLIRPG